MSFKTKGTATQLAEEIDDRPEWKITQHWLNVLGRDAKRGRLVASSREIRAGGLELRRTRNGTVLVQVRKP